MGHTTFAEFVARGGFTTAELPLVLLGVSHVLAATSNNGRPRVYELYNSLSPADMTKTPINNMQPKAYYGVTTPMRALVEPGQLMQTHLERFSSGVRGSQAVVASSDPSADDGGDLQSHYQQPTVETTLHQSFVAAAGAAKYKQWTVAQWNQTVSRACYSELVYLGHDTVSDMLFPSSASTFTSSGRGGGGGGGGVATLTDSIAYLNGNALRLAVTRDTLVHTPRRAQEREISSPATLSAPVLRRTVETLDIARLIVMCGKISPQLHSMGCIAAQMPPWWVEKNTITLLHGVLKHGWKQWESIIFDTSLGWTGPPNWLEEAVSEEEVHLSSLHGRADFAAHTKPHSAFVAFHDLTSGGRRLLLNAAARSRLPNKPCSFLLQNLSSYQLETLVNVTTQNFIEVLLSWCAPTPPPREAIAELGRLEMLPPPSAYDIIHFYIKHGRFPTHGDCRKCAIDPCGENE